MIPQEPTPSQAVLVSSRQISTDAVELLEMKQVFRDSGMAVEASNGFPSGRETIALIVPPRFELPTTICDELPNLRYIGVPSVGTDHVAAFSRRHPEVSVFNAPGFNTEEVAQHAVAMMLMFARGIPAGEHLVSLGSWDARATAARRWENLTVGLIGFGSIGRRVASLCLLLGMAVVVWNRSRIPDEWVGRGIRTAYTPEEVLAKADIVSLHVPDAAQTHHLIDRAALGRMRRGSVLINVGRGGLVDERAVADALDTGILRGVGVDVLDSEPPSADCPLLGRPDVVITPHSAWYSPQASVAAYRIVAERIRAAYEHDAQRAKE